MFDAAPAAPARRPAATPGGNRKPQLESTEMEKTGCFFGVGLGEFERNNPAPVATGNDDVCCRDCNERLVIPARMRQLELAFPESD